jgi:dsRNA-specific ribonuclease
MESVTQVSTPSAATAAAPSQTAANVTPANLVPTTPEEIKTWLGGLQKYLYFSILPLADPNPQSRRRLVETGPMLIWMKAFTHKSVNPNIGQNYEELEKLGDAVMKEIYTSYLMRTYKNITAKELTLFTNYYVAKEAQGPISNSYGLDKWVRSSVVRTKSVSEDILESLFGALKLIGEQYIGIGESYVVCRNLMLNIYKNIQIDWNIIKGDAKSQVKNLFDKMKWISKGEIKEIETWSPNEDGFSGVMTLVFPDKALRDLSGYGLQIPSNILAIAEGDTKGKASKAAYQEALRRLTSLGITSEWVAEQQSENIFTNPNLSPYYPNSLARLKREGYVDMYFKTPQVSTAGYYIQLIGVRPDGSEVILEQVNESSISSGRKEALKLYSEGK